MFLVRSLAAASFLPIFLGAEVLSINSPTTVINDGDGHSSSPWLSDGTHPLQLELDTSALVPTGSTINSLTVRITGSSLDDSYRSEIGLSVSSPNGDTQSWDFGSHLGFPDSAGTYESGSLQASSLTGNASGVFIITLIEDFDDTGNDNEISELTFTLDYSSPSSEGNEPISPYLNALLPTSDPMNGGAQPPAVLSQTGAFSDLANLTARSGFIPYEVNSPLWSDGALKKRWIALPNDGTFDSPSEQITFSATEPWTFPPGTVVMKHFEIPTDAGDSSQVRRLETRFLVAIENGDFYGITYRWRPDGNEADLLLTGASDPITLTDIDGNISTQTWDYPSSQDCRSCHNLGAGIFLGVNTWQLNRETAYPGETQLRNQLTAWATQGIFTSDISNPASYPRAAAVDDTTAPLVNRVRSYLAANCSHCHNPSSSGVSSTSFDLRYNTTLEDSNIVNHHVLYDLGIDEAMTVTPQSPEKSIFYRRLNTTDIHKMPPIGRNIIDTDAVTALNQWIMTLTPDTGSFSNPPLANDDAVLTNQGIPILVDALINDSDVDGDDFSYLQCSTPNHGTTTLDTANNTLTYTPSPDYIGNDEFTYQVIDNTGAVSQPATVSVTVTASATTNSVSFTDSSSLLPDSSSYGGVAMGVVDMDQDGRDDIVHLKRARDLFINYQNENGSFTASALGTVSTQNQWGMALGDADNNGFVDIISGGFFDGLTYHRANNNGTAFTTSTLSQPSIFLQAINFVDINDDGWLDVFPCHDIGANPPFRNTGDGTLVHDPSLIDTTTTAPSDNSGNYGSIWTDYDRDGDLDLYITKCRLGVTSTSDPRRINQLFRNNGDGSYSEVAATAGLADGAQSWTSDFADIDNDGDLDCFIGNHHAASRMMRNNGDGTFTQINSSITGISVTWNVIQSVFRDFNNDGWVDLLLAGEEQGLWINDRDGTFTKLSNPFTSNSMESCAVGDLNKDGFPDIYAGYARIYNTPVSSRPDKLFLNTPNGNGFLSVQLTGRTSNRLASGALLELHGPWGIQLREVRSGEGYGITHSFSHRFGMGNNATATQLIVRWPSGTVDTAYNVSANQFLSLQEGDTAPPTLAAIANQSTNSSSPVTLQISAADPHNNTLTYSAEGLPTGLTINHNTGRITGTTAAVSGTFLVTVSVTDGWSTTSRTFSWSINTPSNSPPTLIHPGNQLTTVGHLITLPLSATDSEGQPLVYSATGLPNGLSIHSQSGLISGTAQTEQTTQTTVSVSDGIDTDSHSFTWTVVPPSSGGGPAYNGLRPLLPARIQAEHFDTEGAGNSYFDRDPENIGQTFRNTGVDIEYAHDVDNTYSLGWIEGGEWTAYAVNVTPGNYDITARIASAVNSPGLIRVILSDRELGFISLPGTGDWHLWQDASLNNVTITENGWATLRLEYVGGPFNLNWIQFDPANNNNEPGNTQQPFFNNPTPLPGRLQAENFDFGGEGMAYQDNEAANLSGSYRDEGVDIEFSNDADDSFSLSWFNNNEWLEYTVTTEPGTYSITARAASSSFSPGDLRISLDGNVLGTINISGTGGSANWADFTLENVIIPAGASSRVLRIESIGSGTNLNWLEFARSDSNTPPTDKTVLLATAFGSWDGSAQASLNPFITTIPDTNAPTHAVTFLTQLGGWLTDTGYVTNHLEYKPLVSIDLSDWNAELTRIDNPSDLPIPPAGYKFNTYRLPEGGSPQAFYRVEIEEK